MKGSTWKMNIQMSNNQRKMTSISIVKALRDLNTLKNLKMLKHIITIFKEQIC